MLWHPFAICWLYTGNFSVSSASIKSFSTTTMLMIFQASKLKILDLFFFQIVTASSFSLRAVKQRTVSSFCYWVMSTQKFYFEHTTTVWRKRDHPHKTPKYIKLSKERADQTWKKKKSVKKFRVWNPDSFSFFLS